MTIPQMLIFANLFMVLVLFIWGRWRYDVVALLALLVAVIVGIVPASEAYIGFSNPAVITVAAVLVVSRGLQNSGIIERLVHILDRAGQNLTLQVALLTSLVAFLSAFMNNVGALAIFIPVAVRMARKNNLSPGIFLMPMAFASLLGGMTTVIGTPPNIILANFRAQTGSAPFGMFDFTPVGLGVALVGLLFVSLVGWRLVPRRKSASSGDLFEIQEYITELKLTAESTLIGRRIRDLPRLAKADAQIVGLIRGGVHHIAPSSFEVLQDQDILIAEADAENLKKLLGSGLELSESKFSNLKELESEDIQILEAIIKPGSVAQYQTARSLNLRARYGVNLLGISREGTRLRKELGQVVLHPGDILLLQGRSGVLQESFTSLGLLPLADRGLDLSKSRSAYLALGIFAVSILVAAFNLLPVQVAFMGAAVAMVITRVVNLRDAYQSIDWPILVLLGGMIPVGQALETTGGADLIANGILSLANQTPPAVTLVVILVGTMFLSDLVNNAAAALLMAPIAVSVAQGLGVSIDPFLMAVAIGASCAFLTPIGHQSNTLVLGPGGYRFGDYWKMGLPLEILIAVVAIPLLLVFFPL